MDNRQIFAVDTSGCARRDLRISNLDNADILYNVVISPLGILYFTMAVIGLSVTLALILAPIISALHVLGIVPCCLGSRAAVDGWETTWIHSPVIMVVGGLIDGILFIATLHRAHLLTALHAILARTMLILRYSRNVTPN